MIINKYKTMEDYQKFKEKIGSKALTKLFKTPKVIFNKFGNSSLFEGVKFKNNNQNAQILESE